MILLIKRKNRFYRRFKRDIWGICYTDHKADITEYKESWVLRFFFKIYKKRLQLRWKKRRRYIYRIDIIDIFYRKKRYNIRWLTIRLTRLYFLTLQDHQFRQLFNKARKLNGNLGNNYCHLLEGRLLSIFYRTNFLADFFKIILFIKRKNVFINFKRLTYLNAVVNVGSFITFKKKLKYYLWLFLKKRLMIGAILFNTPRFLFISFLFIFAYMMRKPQKRDLVYPISIDIQRITGYY